MIAYKIVWWGVSIVDAGAAGSNGVLHGLPPVVFTSTAVFRGGKLIREDENLVRELRTISSRGSGGGGRRLCVPSVVDRRRLNIRVLSNGEGITLGWAGGCSSLTVRLNWSRTVLPRRTPLMVKDLLPVPKHPKRVDELKPNTRIPSRRIRRELPEEHVDLRVIGIQPVVPNKGHCL